MFSSSKRRNNSPVSPWVSSPWATVTQLTVLSWWPLHQAMATSYSSNTIQRLWSADWFSLPSLTVPFQKQAMGQLSVQWLFLEWEQSQWWKEDITLGWWITWWERLVIERAGYRTWTPYILVKCYLMISFFEEQGNILTKSSTNEPWGYSEVEIITADEKYKDCNSS